MSKNIKVFSTPTCPYCIYLKNYLKEKGVKFEEIDLTKRPEMINKVVRKSGHNGVPQMWVDDEVVVGFDVPVINKLLGLS